MVEISFSTYSRICLCEFKEIIKLYTNITLPIIFITILFLLLQMKINDNGHIEYSVKTHNNPEVTSIMKNRKYSFNVFHSFINLTVSFTAINVT